jgi:hypothetical protein
LRWPSSAAFPLSPPICAIGDALEDASPEKGFSEADKRRIVEQAVQPGASLSEVARRYGIAARVLFRWKQELKPSAAPMFVTVQIADATAASDAALGDGERAS